MEHHQELGRGMLEELAHDLLDDEMADLWCSMLRPAITLVPHRDGPVIWRQGGEPSLPPGVDWPVHPTIGALTFLGELDLAAVAASGLDAGRPLPASGRLLLFHVLEEERWDDEGTWLCTGALVPVDDAAGAVPRATPPGPLRLPRADFGGAPRWTGPGWGNPALMRALGLDPCGDEVWRGDNPLTELEQAVADEAPQASVLGGWPQWLGGPVELQVADDCSQAGQWQTLLQLELDGQDDAPQWGMAGVAAWLTRADPAGGLPWAEARCLLHGF